ncbi:tRNA (guanine-N(7)-)-methyltransferase [Thermanaerovibrio velox DSM 12556]|uniref:tRNA (guanine-N(7)-)-methyltransferase n=1 Tax=Thermanaerovibrio velox DSM 12556 TaxID=926567 RepID=H0US39_9BACT|nr:tRNA (guanosine(46)-N7)-methyltransferase TrmB [Thermanaerovibrio velox]EHM10128.1 tRNA (guanine-N(7)-)-methyltransferase [Thermanaerovibrio velox DSM 12556]
MSWALGKVILNGPLEKLPLDLSFPGWDGRVFLEIGFGDGGFLAYLASKESRAAVVGMEVCQWCATKAARRVLRLGLDNVRILRGDARYLIGFCFKRSSLDGVILNFPCPWPKKRHTERRVTSPRFAGLLSEYLKPKGVFSLATDVEWYAMATMEFFEAMEGFSVVQYEVNPVRGFLTKYERKWKAQGRDTYLVEVRYEGGAQEHIPVEDACPYVEEDFDMEVAWQQVSREVEIYDLVGTLRDRKGGKEGHMFVFRDIFRGGDGVILVSAITVDDGFEQHFYIRFYPKGNGYGVKLDPVGHPYRTPAVRMAIKEAAGVLRVEL